LGSCVHILAKSDRDLSLSFSNKYTTTKCARARTHTPQLVSVKELKKLRKQVHEKKKNPRDSSSPSRSFLAQSLFVR
jgi:hypothetical protein